MRKPAGERPAGGSAINPQGLGMGMSRTARFSANLVSAARRLGLACLGALLVQALLSAPAWARPGDARAGLFLGTTTTSVDGFQTFGSTYGANYGYEFETDLLWTASLAFSSTEGKAVVDVAGTPTEVTLQSRTASLQTGLLAFFAHSQAGLVIPFLGAGLSVMSYDLQYPHTSIGTTSGTGPGAYANAGVELRLTRSITLIPQIGLQVNTIKTQTGESKGLLSGGLIFTVRIST